MPTPEAPPLPDVFDALVVTAAELLEDDAELTPDESELKAGPTGFLPQEVSNSVKKAIIKTK